MSIELLAAVGTLLAMMIAGLAGLWAKIDSTFVRKDVDAERLRLQTQLDQVMTRALENGIGRRLGAMDSKIDTIMSDGNKRDQKLDALRRDQS